MWCSKDVVFITLACESVLCVAVGLVWWVRTTRLNEHAWSLRLRFKNLNTRPRS